jgi:hypothetical protein
VFNVASHIYEAFGEKLRLEADVKELSDALHTRMEEAKQDFYLRELVRRACGE